MYSHIGGAGIKIIDAVQRVQGRIHFCIVKELQPSRTLRRTNKITFKRLKI